MNPNEFMFMANELINEGEKKLVGDITSGYRYVPSKEIEKERINMIKREECLNFIKNYVNLRGLNHQIHNTPTTTKLIIGNDFRCKEYVNMRIEWSEVRCSIGELTMTIINEVESKLKVPNSYSDCYDFVRYCENDVKNTKALITSVYGRSSYDIDDVIFNDPATIVKWKDGTKTVVKAIDEDFDPEKGLAMAIVKKTYGNKGNYFNQIKKWLPEEEIIETNGRTTLEELSAAMTRINKAAKVLKGEK